MPRTPYCAGVRGLSSTFILTTLSLPAYSRDSSSTTGPMARHGPHHGAQKSMSTGVGLCSTSRSKDSSDTASTSDMPGAEQRPTVERGSAPPGAPTCSPEGMLTLAEADALFARRRDAWLREDHDAYLACWAEDMTFQSPVHTEPLRGRDAYASLIRASAQAVRPLRFDVDHLAVRDDVVLAEWEIEAEHRASGARLRWRGM